MRRPQHAITGLAAGALLLLTACDQDNAVEEIEAEFFQPGRDPGDDPTLDAEDPQGAETEAPPGFDEEDVFEGESLTDADLTTASSPLGDHLVDGQGRTLYVFMQDPPGESTCVEDCLATWPIFSSDGPADVDGDADEGLVGTSSRDDDVAQLTYADQPLYYYVEDRAAGDQFGQGVGGQWFLVAPDGEPIRDDPAEE
jgi:predicted lipoprotein with Yx(FWY)xxD motif